MRPSFISPCAIALAASLAACSPEPEPETADAADAPAAPAPPVMRDALGPFSAAREADGLVYFSSVLAPPNEDGRTIGDVESQTGAALTLLRELLQDEGLGYEHVLHVTVYIVEEDGRLDVSGFTRAWQRAFATRLQPAAPARTVVGVSALPQEGARVALEAVAARPSENTASPAEP
ncbi:hypothetical protein DDZ18_07525 [Marinicauda salina]|uniref:RidA family protein n=1 Tax=Marinicauda salina TaxID=2135793 RepID=A0A2U2BU53_9PROT|nr:RidA family protein [Marinicauda salina]PWE17512.1 hypothetical protein DDZ18_07525 [Marinicauda salina]